MQKFPHLCVIPMISPQPTKLESREMLTAVNTYADDTLLSIDDALYKALTDVRRIRQGISNAQHKEG